MQSTKAKKTQAVGKAIPYVLKENYLQVTIKGKPFTLESSHPTFERMKKAILARRWGSIPGLVNIAQNLIAASHGSVSVKNGVVHYKGSPVDSSLTQHILELANTKKPVEFMLKFMENLFQNPSPEARGEFYDWFRYSGLPITDDGCFLAYKSVDSDMKDEHTHKIDNSPGQVILGSRSWFDTDYRTQCSTGYHVCSKQYGLYGKRVMAVKVNPADILSCSGGKMRVVNYEVLYELGRMEEIQFKKEGFAQLEKKVAVEIGSERKGLIKMLLNSKAVRRIIKAGKIKEETIKKAPYARLKNYAQKYEAIPQEQVVPPTDGMTRLQAARKASGITLGQIAKQTGMGLRAVTMLEKKDPPPPEAADAFLAAIGALNGIRNLSYSAITYPVPVKEGRASR